MIYKYLFFATISFFILTNCSTTKVNVCKKMVNGENVKSIDKNPEFIGGWDEYEKYIKQNLTYPKNAKLNGIVGEVRVSFIVRKTGKITDVEIEKSIAPELDNEAIRLVSNMPDWSPGISNGDTVSVSLTVPLTFSLD